ncbi:MAG: hypothetical protein KF836_07845 [Fimbriimonadaceae bacterium]|nr:hypothetical protein [Fimbriimonadaceae bacterium]
MSSIPLDNFGESLEGKSVMLLTSASFERRCTVIPRIVSQNAENSEAILIFNEENLLSIDENMKLIESCFSGSICESFAVSGSNPIKSADTLHAIAKRLVRLEVDEVIVDVSAMMRESLLILLAALKSVEEPRSKISFVYVPAQYGQKASMASSASGILADRRPRLSFGILEVRSVVGFPGDYSPASRRHLILLTGFEVERARAVIQSTEPTHISIGVGLRERSTTGLNASLDLSFAEELLNDYGSLASRFNIYPDSANDTATAIVSEREKFKGYKTIICSMNTKVSTCGAAIVAMSDSAVGMVYAQPALYNQVDYADPLNEVYAFEMPIWTP